MGIQTHQNLSAPPEEVFDWFARPGAFARLNPPFSPLRLVSEASSLKDGEAVLAMPLGLRWVAEHQADGFLEGRRFVDRPVSRGPRSWPMSLVPWEHTHEVLSDDAGGSLVRDTVATPLPRGFLERMFTYRHEQLRLDLRSHAWASAAGVRRLTVAMTGSSGLVGTALRGFLTTGGHRVIRWVRGTPSGPDQVHWDPERPDPRALEGIDAIVHLAGEPIAGRFTREHLARVEDSRVGPTAALARAARQAGVPVFVSASAIGVYGAQRGDEVLAEDAAAPDGENERLAGIVSRWEDASALAAGQGTRAVQVRTGLVQSAGGGLLKPLRLLAGTGLSGRVGDGKQWQSWIALDDLVDVYHRALWDEGLSGPVNAVAPHPVRNQVYMETLAHVLRRPSWLPVPAAGPALLLGEEGARELAMASQRVSPSRLQERGHAFRYPFLEAALRHTLGKVERNKRT